MEIIEQKYHLSPTNPNLVFPDEYLSIFKWLGIWLAVHFTLYNTVFKRFVMWSFPDSKLKTCYNRRQKLYTALWKLTYFGSTSMFGLYLMRTESWVLDPSQYFINWPNQDMSTAVKIYYNIQMAGYMHALLTMPFEPKQTIRDYIALLIHHASTLFLLWNSYTGGFYRIGVAVATLHDLSDPIMEFAKILLYLEYSKLADVAFGTFAVFFLVSRTYVFPCYLITSVPKYFRYDNGYPMPDKTYYYTMQAVLWSLFLLHVYWGFLILTMVKSAIVNKGVSDDVRNVDKDEKID